MDDLDDIIDDLALGWGEGETPEEVERGVGDLARDRVRLALVAKLRAEGELDLASDLDGCGAPLHLHCTCCGDIRTVAARCKKRWCPVCARRIAAKRVAKYEAAVAQMSWPIFVTLTRLNVRIITPKTLQEMRAAFRKLRARKWWSEQVVGGVASVEISNIGNGWHPHIHAVIDCRWLGPLQNRIKPHDGHSQAAAKCKNSATFVAAEWAKALGHKRASVKIKRAYGRGSNRDPSGNSKPISLEVLKYACKAQSLVECQEPIGDLLRVIRTARLVSSWGSCYGDKLVIDEPTIAPTACGCGAEGCWIPEDCLDSTLARYRAWNKIY